MFLSVSLVELNNYFLEILFNYDRDWVLIGDIKKVIKWFKYLNDKGLFIIKEIIIDEEE